MKKLITLAVLLLTLSVSAQIRYVCFQNDNNQNLFISVKFNGERPIGVKYSGQNAYIQIKFKKRSVFDDGGHMSWWNETYNEIVNGKIKGTYVMTNSGTHALDFQYYRRDGKKFYFAVYESGSDDPEFPYTTTPTF